MQQKVTIILLHRNRSFYLRESLASVAVQSYSDWELLVSDNSTDSMETELARSITTEFAKQNSNHVRFVSRGGNLHVSAHVQRCLSECDTPVVAFHNDDDVWLKHHLKTSLDTLKAHAAAFVACNYTVIDASGKAIAHEACPTCAEELPYTNLTRLFLSSIYGNLAGMTFCLSYLSRFPSVKTDMIDVALAVNCLGQGGKGSIVYAPTYLYRRHAGSLTGTRIHGQEVKRFEESRCSMRFWAAKNYLLRLTLQCPEFPLLLVKDAFLAIQAYARGRRTK